MKSCLALLALIGVLVLAACGGGGSGGGGSGGGGGNSNSSISGTITGASSVTVNLTGAANAQTVTDANGNYSFGSLANGSYTITPSKTGYTFSPASLTITVSGGNVTSQNFTATSTTPTYWISGVVSGTIADGVLITLGGASVPNTTTTGGGHYSFSGIANGSYTLTPSATGYRFDPLSLPVTVNGADVTGQDFTSIVTNLSLKWQYNTGGAIYYSSPAIGSDGTVYFGNGAPFQLAAPDSRYLYAVNPDGSLKWSYNVTFNTDSPAIAADGTVYVQDTLSTVYAFAADGTLKWKYQLSCALDVGQVVPAIGRDGTVYIGADGLYAINPDGTLKWRVGLPLGASEVSCPGAAGKGQIRSGPAIAPDGTIYAAVNLQSTVNVALMAVNPDGSLKWERDFGGWASQTPNEPSWIFSSPAVAADGTIYFGSETDGDINSIFALNPDGTVKWRYDVSGGRTIRSSPTIATDGTIYIGTKSGSTMVAEMLALNPDGTLKWSYPIATVGDDIYCTPTVAANGRIVFGAESRLLYVLNPDGTLNDVFNTNNGICWTSPAIAPDGTIYIGNNGGTLFAIGSSSLGLAHTSWPRFHQNSQNTGRYDGP